MANREYSHNTAKRSGSSEEAGIVADYDRRYCEAATEALLRVECTVLGSDFGVTSYTTLKQAEELVARLQLGPGHRVLDLGSGAGWPGLHLAIASGCRLVGSDLALRGLLSTARRADIEGMASRVAATLCSGRDLPFRRQSFDAVVHADFFC